MNIYEQFVYDELERQKLAAFLPYKDRGVDCIVTRQDFSGKPQKVQIKGSRTYLLDGGGWYQIKDTSLRTSNTATDFWVFVSTKTGKKGSLQPVFIVVPTAELYNKLTSYAMASKGKYNLYLTWSDGAHKDMVVDTRAGTKGWKNDPWPIPPNSLRDYTRFANNWKLLSDAM